jgi:hypothetical protein
VSVESMARRSFVRAESERANAFAPSRRRARMFHRRDAHTRDRRVIIINPPE